MQNKNGENSFSSELAAKTATNKSRQGIQVIARASSILRSLENEPDGLSLSQIANKVDLPRSTVQRIVNALEEEHLLIAASLNARVKLGPTILRLAANTNFDFANTVRPHMEELSKRIEETVDLSMYRGDHMVFVDQIRGNHRLSAISEVGEELPLHSAANGKAALSMMEDKQIVALVEQNLIKETSNTVGTIEQLMAQIAVIRDTKVAVDNEEHEEGICAVATAFCDPLGRIFTASIPVPSVRFHRMQDSLTQALLDFRSNLIESIQAP